MRIPLFKSRIAPLVMLKFFPSNSLTRAFFEAGLIAGKGEK